MHSRGPENNRRNRRQDFDQVTSAPMDLKDDAQGLKHNPGSLAWLAFVE